MSCDEIRGMLGSYLLSEVDDEEQALIETHVNSCESCRAEMESLQETISEIYAQVGREAPESSHQKADPEAVPATVATAPRRWGAWAAAAIVLISASVGVGMWATRDGGPLGEPEPQPYLYSLLGTHDDVDAPEGAQTANPASPALSPVSESGMLGVEEDVPLDDFGSQSNRALSEDARATLEELGYTAGEAASSPKPVDLPSLSSSASRMDFGTSVSTYPSSGELGWEEADELHFYAFKLGDAGGVPGKKSKVPARGRRRALKLNVLPGSAETPSSPAAPYFGLEARKPDGTVHGVFPLRRTDVDASISGFLAATRVQQKYENPFDEAIEAVYVFPLPTDAAVHQFEMIIGSRRIVGVIREKEEAKKLYEQARARGQTASLLTQQRTNIFTQSVANIEARGEVDISITFYHTLEYQDHEYEYVFPMVVGPRYNPAGTPEDASPNPPVESGGSPSDDVATDEASNERVRTASPPVSLSGVDHTIGIEVDIHSPVPIADVRCPTHKVVLERPDPDRARVVLDSEGEPLNRDFVLRYRIAADAIAGGVLSHHSAEHGGFVTLLVVPPHQAEHTQVTPREVTFILDTSGSMSGLPMNASKQVVYETLASLRPFDRFNIIRFAGDSSQLSATPLENTEANIARARSYVEGLEGGGGTEMLQGVRAYLETEGDPTYVRVVCFLTDGYVGNEEQILAMIRDQGQGTRWFGFGIGSSVNRMLIEGIGEFGSGQSMVVLPRDEESSSKAARKFMSWIDSPALLDIEVDWGTLPVSDVYPKKPADLFAGGPLVMVARYASPAQGDVIVRGKVAGQVREYRVPVTLSASNNEHEALGSVWARRRIADLSAQMLGKDDPEIRKTITQLALEFSLVSPYTSFVAVDESRIVGDGRPLRILQPVELPEGVSAEGIFGGMNFRQAFSIEVWGVVLGLDDQGGLVVVQVEAQSKFELGDRLTALDGTELQGSSHLQGLLLQAHREEVQVTVQTNSGETRVQVIKRP